MSYTTINGKPVRKIVPKASKLMQRVPEPEYRAANVKPSHSMASLALIRVGNERFTFFHNDDTDGRELYDQDDNLVLTVDSSLNFRDIEGRFANLHNEGGKWVFYYGPLRTRFDTDLTVNTPFREYCWEQLEQAEIVAIKHWLESELITPPLDAENNIIETTEEKGES